MRRKLLLILFLVLSMTLFAVFLIGAGELPQVVASEPAKPAAEAAQSLVKPDFVFGDPLPDAPKLAYRGVTTDIVPGGLVYSVGVRTLTLVNPGQIDILSYSNPTNTHPLYDRPITVEVWYPAFIPPGSAALVEEKVVYTDVLGISGSTSRPNIPFAFAGRAIRNADPFTTTGAPFPLVIVSHGYPGSRYMMTYLDENLASKGYVVVAIDHTESTFDNYRGFQSTLLNRSLDQLFVLDQMGHMDEDTGSFLYGLVDADHTAIVGYSMGGYGALNSAGAGINISSPLQSWVPGGYLSLRSEGNPTYTASLDPRLKAIVAFAPWGDSVNAWTPSALANIMIPSLFVVGSRDDIALYNQGTGGAGVSRVFSRTVNSERYMLVYQNASHNVAPNPPPQESWYQFAEYERYSEPVWSNARINNINQHFVTAFLGMVLKGQSYSSYLNVVQNSNDGVWPTTYWKGFINRTALGMELHYNPSATVRLPLIFKDWQLHW